MLEAGRHPSQRRLSFEELLAHHLSLKLIKHESQTEPAWVLDDRENLAVRFISSLPFPLTNAQARALPTSTPTCWSAAHGAADTGRCRLRQDSGRRGGGGARRPGAVCRLRYGADGAAGGAALAQLRAGSSRSACRSRWFRDRSPARTRRSALELIASGEVRIAVGTHALFQEAMDFQHLALVIVDEQHRFGVQQRLRLQEKGRSTGRFPHQLIMTATPIPRTLAMTAYADLDISVIDELPPGRTPVKTVVVPEQRRDEVVARIVRALPRGPAGILGVSADRGVRGAAFAGGGRDGRCARRRRCRQCESGWSTAACRPRRRTRRCWLSRTERSRCSSRPPSSRSAWTCPMQR